MPIGVVVERRRIDHPWAEWTWRPIDAMADPPPIEDWHVLTERGDVTHYYAATATMTLHRKLVEAYRVNLAGEAPVLWVVLQEDDQRGSDRPYRVHMVTASPYEAQDYLDSGEEIVEAVPMPEAVLATVIAFVKAHPEEQAFRKRKRDRIDPQQARFGKQPIFARQARPQE